MRISGYGLSIELPDGWDGRIYARPVVEPSVIPGAPGAPIYRAPDAAGGTASLHAASFPLPVADGDFGTTATATMPRHGVFLALLEYQPGQGLEPGRGLFADRAVPASLPLSEFAPAKMIRALPGQAGTQRFFTAAGRPFCMYVVLGSQSHAKAPLAQLSAALATVAVQPLPAG